MKQTSTAQSLSDKLFLILSVSDHFDFTDVTSKKKERKTSQTKQYNTISINVKRSDGLPVRSVRITCSRSLLHVHLHRDQVLVHEKGRRHKRTNTKPSASTRDVLMICQFEVYESFAHALSHLCICIVVRFSFMIMQSLPFRFMSTLAHQFRATGVISQFLG